MDYVLNLLQTQCSLAISKRLEAETLYAIFRLYYPRIQGFKFDRVDLRDDVPLESVMYQRWYRNPSTFLSGNFHMVVNSILGPKYDLYRHPDDTTSDWKLKSRGKTVIVNFTLESRNLMQKIAKSILDAVMVSATTVVLVDVINCRLYILKREIKE